MEIFLFIVFVLTSSLEWKKNGQFNVKNSQGGAYGFGTSSFLKGECTGTGSFTLSVHSYDVTDIEKPKKKSQTPIIDISKYCWGAPDCDKNVIKNIQVSKRYTYFWIYPCEYVFVVDHDVGALVTVIGYTPLSYPQKHIPVNEVVDTKPLEMLVDGGDRFFVHKGTVYDVTNMTSPRIISTRGNDGTYLSVFNPVRNNLYIVFTEIYEKPSLTQYHLDPNDLSTFKETGYHYFPDEGMFYSLDSISTFMDSDEEYFVAYGSGGTLETFGGKVFYHRTKIGHRVTVGSDLIVVQPGDEGGTYGFFSPEKYSMKPLQNTSDDDWNQAGSYWYSVSFKDSKKDKLIAVFQKGEGACDSELYRDDLTCLVELQLSKPMSSFEVVLIVTFSVLGFCCLCCCCVCCLVCIIVCFSIRQKDSFDDDFEISDLWSNSGPLLTAGLSCCCYLLSTVYMIACVFWFFYVIFCDMDQPICAALTLSDYSFIFYAILPASCALCCLVCWLPSLGICLPSGGYAGASGTYTAATGGYDIYQVVVVRTVEYKEIN